MANMEILTLLNTAATSSGKSISREASPSSSHEDLATPPSTAVPTPSPEPSWSRPQVADKHHEQTQTWDAEETSTSLHTDSGFGWNANFTFPFKGDSLGYTRLEMDPSGSETSRDGHRRPHRIVTDGSSYRPQDPSPAEDAFVPSSADPFRVPDYRRHKFSDSHSSLASLATSRSEAHSRISSVTTINEIPSIDSVLSEVSQADASSPGLPASSPTQAERRSRFKSQDASLSPRGRSRTGLIVPRITRAASPSDVALNLKQGGIVKPPTSATMSTHPQIRNTGRLSAPRTHKRAVSAPVFPPLPRRLPSFTINQARPLLPPPHQMMSAPRGSPFPNEEVSFLRNGPPEVIREHEPIRPVMTTRHTDSETTSATASVAGSHMTSPTTVSQSSAGAQAKSQPDDVWDIDDENLRMPSFEELELHGMQDETVQCIFVDKCATNSPIRKSVSHFFGRNKGTTLQIPEHIWLVYCRQHYQRLRYRLGQKYALHQLDLVKVVIHRIERWGKDNKAKKDGAEVLDWQIMLRKCVRDEQERWTRFKQDLRRQAISQQEQDERYEAFKMSRVGHSKYNQHVGLGHEVAPTSGLMESNNSAAETLLSIERNYPWLLDTLGDHRAENEVISVIDRLRQDYKASLEAKSPSGVAVIKELPPIEFLPNLSNDNDDRPLKTGRKRGPARTSRASESFKRRATRSVESPDEASPAESYSQAGYEPAYASQLGPSPFQGGSASYDHPQMAQWMGRPGQQERSMSRSNYIVPRMQPLNYGYRSSAGSGSTANLTHESVSGVGTPGLERIEQSRNYLPAPRPTHHRSASAFTPMSRYTSTLERPSSSGEGSSGGRTQEQGDYFSTFAMGGPQRNTHIFGDLGGYQMASNNRPPVFDFTPRTRPGLWTEAEAPELPRVTAWSPHEASVPHTATYRPEGDSQQGGDKQ